MYTIILFIIVCRMNKHKCDIDFEKHTPLMHVTLLVEKKNYTHVVILFSSFARRRMDLT